MPTATDNYAFQVPVDGGDDDTWGGFLNGNWVALDAILQDFEDRVAEVEAKYRIPVGGLFLSTVATAPATLLGYGTWVAHAAGRALVGVGNNGESSWAGGDQRGSETHTLTEAQLPAHDHEVDPPSTNTSSNGLHNHAINRNNTGAALRILEAQTNAFGGIENAGSGISWFDSTTTVQNDGEHTHSVNIAAFDSGETGDGDPHNNLQPSIAVYVWRRTA